jgi:hypothetical protein
VAIDDLLELAFAPARLPGQRELHTDFGQPPITLFDNGQFYVSVLFWLDGTTVIHEHNFSGAFHVLHGGSIHTTFDFASSRTISEYLRIGALHQRNIEVLERGATREIRSGSDTIHSLFHLDRPSASVVVRTASAAVSRPQLTYSRSGVAYWEDFDLENLKRRKDLMGILNSRRPGGLRELISPWLESTDFLSAFIGLRHAVELLAPEAGDALLAGMQSRHEGLAALVGGVVEHGRQEYCIVRRRAATKDPSLRFFLAVLMNARGREDALRLIRARFPEQDPVERILEWVVSLAKAPPVEPGDPSALGFAIDDIVIRALRGLLGGQSPDVVVKDLRTSGVIGAEDEALARELCEALRESEIFRCLLAS